MFLKNAWYVAAWADEIADLVREHGGGNTQIACDRLDGSGVHALEARGLSYVEGTQITEIARAIKSPSVCPRPG